MSETSVMTSKTDEAVIRDAECYRKEIRAEAFNEFAEQLKEKLSDCRIVTNYVYTGYDTGDVLDAINQLVKEKTKEKDMIDIKIIKALECCSSGEMLNCRNCPYDESCNMGRSDMQKDALDLINRQKAEIEQWKDEANKYQSLWASACTEAIKEFAEELTYRISHNDEIVNRDSWVIISVINDLVKERAESEELK